MGGGLPDLEAELLVPETGRSMTILFIASKIGWLRAVELLLKKLRDRVWP